MEEWSNVLGFLGYSVSNMGRVRNESTGRILTVLRNGDGTCYVGLTKGRKQLRRSLALLVATAFVPKVSGRVEFDRPLHLDGDQTNNRADNLVWRPHWFMVQYYRQIKTGKIGSDIPVMETRKIEIFPNSYEAALAYGLLESQIIASLTTGTFVYPTFQHFKYHLEEFAEQLRTRA